MTNRMVVFDEPTATTPSTVELDPDVLVIDVPVTRTLEELSDTEFLIFDAPPPAVEVVTTPSDFLLVDATRSLVAVTDDGDDDVLVITTQGVMGPQGPPGESVEPYEYLMPIPATTVFVNHPLGYDPVAVQVFVDNELCSDYSVVYTITNEQVRLGFDVTVQALIRLM